MTRNAIVFGGSGLVGKALIKLLSENRNYTKVIAYFRHKPENLPVKIQSKPITDDVTINPQVDDVFICLGTTMRKAGSKDAFRKVDFEMVVELAEKAQRARAQRLVVISSIGANPKSRNFYLRTKGQLEEKVKQLNYELCAIIRPSLLLGHRNEFRLGERLSIWLYRIFRFTFVGPLRRYRGIDATDVAKAMISLALSAKGCITVESETLKQIAEVYHA